MHCNRPAFVLYITFIRLKNVSRGDEQVEVLYTNDYCAGAISTTAQVAG